MQLVGRYLNFVFLPVASNDNEDLLAFALPSVDLAFIREVKHDLRAENAATGVLLCSRRQRRFFQEVMDAELYILLRYFTFGVSEMTLRRLKRRILDCYLAPRRKRGRRSTHPKSCN